MAKIAIILCAVLLASAADADYIPYKLQLIQRKVDGMISMSEGQMKSKFESVHSTARRNLDYVKAEAARTEQRAFDKIKLMIQNTQNEAARITSRAGNINVKDCTIRVQDLVRASARLQTKITQCVNGKSEQGERYLSSMQKINDDVVLNLRGLRRSMQFCCYDANNPRSATRAMYCARTVAFKTAWVSTKTVPKASTRLTQLNHMLSTLKPSLAYCENAKNLVVLSQLSANVLKQTEKCVNEKISKADKKKKTISTSKWRKTTTKMIRPTTETVPTTKRIITTNKVRTTTEIVPTTKSKKITTKVVQPSTERTVQPVTETSSTTECEKATIEVVQPVTETESTTQSEEVTTKVVPPVAETDSTTQSEEVTTEVVQTVAETDSTTQSEEVTTEVVEPVAETDSTTQSEEVTTEVVEPVAETDSTTQSEEVTTEVVEPVAETDSTTQSEEVTTEVVQPVAETDSTTESEEVTTEVIQPVAETDSTTQSEEVTTEVVQPVAETDSTTESEEVTTEVIQPVAETDSTTESEEVATEVVQPVTETGSTTESGEDRPVSETVLPGKHSAAVEVQPNINSVVNVGVGKTVNTVHQPGKDTISSTESEEDATNVIEQGSETISPVNTGESGLINVQPNVNAVVNTNVGNTVNKVGQPIPKAESKEDTIQVDQSGMQTLLPEKSKHHGLIAVNPNVNAVVNTEVGNTDNTVFLSGSDTILPIHSARKPAPVVRQRINSPLPATKKNRVPVKVQQNIKSLANPDGGKTTKQIIHPIGETASENARQKDYTTVTKRRTRAVRPLSILPSLIRVQPNVNALVNANVLGVTRRILRPLGANNGLRRQTIKQGKRRPRAIWPLTLLPSLIGVQPNVNALVNADVLGATSGAIRPSPGGNGGLLQTLAGGGGNPLHQIFGLTGGLLRPVLGGGR